MRLKNKAIHLWGSLDESWRFAITVFVIARLFYALWSWVIFSIQPVAIQNFVLNAEPILSVFRLKDSETHVYLRQVSGNILTFKVLDTETLVDGQSGTLWNISSGVATQGSYQGLSLSSAQTRTSTIFPYYEAKPFPGTFLALWQRFDANLYVSIAEQGYGRIPGDTHFPPLYPLLIRLMQFLVGNTFLAGLVVSHLATLYMLKLLYDVFKAWGGVELGRRALLFLAIYPTFFFFFSVYSEPVFLVSVLLAFRNMKTRSWAWAGFWTFCAILTRLQGVALLLPMLYLMRRDYPFLRKSAHWLGLALPGFGGLFYLYLRAKQTTVNTLPLLESEWQARLAFPGETYLYAIKTMISGNATFIDILNFVIATLFLVLLVIGWKKIPLEYNLFMLGNFFILLSRVVETQPLNSMSRFSLTLFPAFYTLGLVGNDPWARRVIIYSSVLLSLYLSGQFFIWGWVA